MDILTVIQIALFLPFLFFLLIFSIIYLINGYKKDFGKSLISLAATIIAICISLLLAKGLGWALSGLVVSILPAEVTNMLAEFGTLGTNLAKGAIQVALSFLLFDLFFVISLAVLKSVGKKKINWDKLEKLNTGKTGTRLAGMGIRALDAVLVTIMLLIPLYGTIAMVAPPVATVAQLFSNPSPMQIQENSRVAPQVNDITPEKNTEEDAEFVDFIDSIANHPVLAPYKFGPGSWVYSSLSSFAMNENTVDIATASKSLTKILDMAQTYIIAIQEQDYETATETMQELIDYSRKEVIDERWSYELVMAIITEIDAMITEHADELAEEEFLEMYNQVKPLFNMTFEEYTHNAEGILDFASWALETYSKNINADLSDEQLKKLTDELLSRLGDLLNHSEQAIGLKRIVLQIYAEEMFECLPDINDPQNADYYAARKGIPNTGVEFINKHFGNGLVAKENRAAEASAFLALMSYNNTIDIAEIFTRHPLFSADAVLEAMDENLYIKNIDIVLVMQLEESGKADETYEYFDNLLKKCEQADVYDVLSFRNDIYSYLYIDLGLENYYFDDMPVDYESNGEITIHYDPVKPVLSA